MYFIGYGKVVVTTTNGRVGYHCEAGDHFGEICFFLHDQRRRGNAIALEYCELYRLEQSDFNATIQPYPKLYEKFEILALKRLDLLRRCEEEHQKELHEVAASV